MELAPTKKNPLKTAGFSVCSGAQDRISIASGDFNRLWRSNPPEVYPP
jgi:hypothetical protein